MTHYNKGASAERELLALLYESGMAVCRAAGSGKGKNTIPTPDAIALRHGKIYAFECKAWKAKNLNISHIQMNDLEKWCQMAGAELLIAWKVPNKGWLFLQKKRPAYYRKSLRGIQKKSIRNRKKNRVLHARKTAGSIGVFNGRIKMRKKEG